MLPETKSLHVKCFFYFVYFLEQRHTARCLNCDFFFLYWFSVKPARHLMGLPLPRLELHYLRCCRSRNRHHLTDVSVRRKRYNQCRPAKASNNCNSHCDRTTTDTRRQSFLQMHVSAYEAGTQRKAERRLRPRNAKTLSEVGRQHSCKVE